jgi:BirA family biotin operon repressor/biotin-[acetyl-CoA-carboxylase] ligase
LQNNVFPGLFVGQNLVTLKEVDSTSTFLKNIVSNSTPVPEGTVIMAESQTAGRGQRQNKWYSQTGESLTFSLLLNPQFLPLDQQYDLTRAISLGVYDALHQLLGEQVKIKWPNDIYYRGGKLGGILIENQVQGSRIKHSVIGIGLNVNQAVFPDWVPNGISVKQILHTDYDLRALLSQICSHIEFWYIKLRSGEHTLIREQYLQRLYRFNQPSLFKAGGEIFEGTIKGVTVGGLLQVEQNHQTVLYNLKEIEFLHD